MDSNRSEAERAAEVGKDALQKRDWARAARFFTKSYKLYPMKEVAELLRLAEKAMADGSASGEERRASSDGGARANGHASSRSHDASDDSLRQRHPSAPSSSAGDGEACQATPEQIELVRRIRRQTNYYEILELRKDASDDEIKKAYRKLSLKVHPDKNKAPGADEAFKVVSRAFQCLSDEELRTNYDRYGHEDPQVVARQRRQQQQGMSTMYFDDGFDPNDIFNAFFFGNPSGNVFRAEFGHGGFHFQRGRQHARQQYYQQQQQQQQQQRQAQAQAHAGSVYPLLQIIPIIFLFLFMMLPSPSEPVFKLDQSSTYPHQIVSSKAQIPYYVRSVQAFDKEYPEDSKARRHVEQQVEGMYKEYYDTRCHYERVQQEQYMRWGQRKRAESMRMPFCEEANRLTQILGQA